MEKWQEERLSESIRQADMRFLETIKNEFKSMSKDEFISYMKEFGLDLIEEKEDVHKCCRFCKHLNPHEYEWESYDYYGNVIENSSPTLCDKYKDGWDIYDINKDYCGYFEPIDLFE